MSTGVTKSRDLYLRNEFPLDQEVSYLNILNSYGCTYVILRAEFCAPGQYEI